MPSVAVSPPIDGTRSPIAVNGRTYACPAGGSIPVPDFDAEVLLANGWTYAVAAAAAPSNLGITTDGMRCVVQLYDASGQPLGIYLGASGPTIDLSQATDLRGPAIVTNIGTTSDPNGSLTIDPATGDLYQSSGK